MALARCGSHAFHDAPGDVGGPGSGVGSGRDRVGRTRSQTLSTASQRASTCDHPIRANRPPARRTAPRHDEGAHTMKDAKLGDLTVSRIGLGAMGMSHGYTGAGTNDAESIRTIHRALDLGVTLI